MSRVEATEFTMREGATVEATARERCEELLFHLARSAAQVAKEEAKDASEMLGEWLGRVTYELTAACRCSG